MDFVINFTELKDNQNYIYKTIDIQPDGTPKSDARAKIYSGTARTLALTPTEFVDYLTNLSNHKDTCIMPTVWVDGYKQYSEFDICKEDNEKPEIGLISRTNKFFKYLNSDSVSFMVFDFDGNNTKEEIQEFITGLESILFDSVLPAVGTVGKIMRFEKPSSSARIKINGKVKNGLHVYVPVRNMDAKLLNLIFRWAWLTKWPSHLINAGGKVEARSIIDATVAGHARLFFEADPEITGCTELVEELVERKCNYYPGGVIDCGGAISILERITTSFNFEWSAYKREIEKTPECIEAAALAKTKETAKLIGSGVDKKTAAQLAKMLVEDEIITSSAFLTKSDGTQVSVYDILTDRDSYLGQKNFLDYLDPKPGTNKAMILGDDYSVRLKSFARGGVFYQLKFDYDGLKKFVSDAAEDELMDWFSIYLAQAEMPESHRDKLIKVVARSMNTTVTAIKNDAKKYLETIDTAVRTDKSAVDDTPTIDPKSDHATIAEDMLAFIGECRVYSGRLYNLNNSIWKVISREQLASMFSKRYAYCNKCKDITDYNKLAGWTSDKPELNQVAWESTVGIPCVSKFLKVGPNEVDENGFKGTSWAAYSPDLGCRFKLNYNPDWTCETPYWNKVLDNVVNKRAFQQVFGLTLSGYITRKAQIAAVFYGIGGTGKGTVARIFKSMMPKERVTSVSISQMSDEKSVIPLADSYINIIAETKKSSNSNSNLVLPTEGLKMATGGDDMQAWRLYKGPIAITPTASQVLMLNDWPTLDSVGEEIKRRLGHFIIEFRKNYDEVIDSMADFIIERELPGVLAWAIDGIVDYFSNGIDDEHSLMLWKAWTSSVDQITLFTSECLVESDHQGFSTSALWKLYDKWAADSGYYKYKKGAFNNAVQRTLGVSFKGDDKDRKLPFYVLSSYGRELGKDFLKSGHTTNIRKKI